MVNLEKRSPEKELLDGDDIPFADIKQNMAELDTINRLLGGHLITIKGLKAFNPGTHHNWSVCEIGCGGGDNLRALYSYSRSKNMHISFTGIDIKKECIDFAAQQNSVMNATWICCDYKLAPLPAIKPDIIFSSLFCHHFSQEELVFMLRWMHENSSQGFFINDLHRHRLAWLSIRWLTALFSRSYLVKHDAPLSVARGFKKKEWQEIFKLAGIQDYVITWQWAFRHLIVCKK